MRAVMYSAFGGRIEVQTVPDPAPSPSGVVVMVEATGLCRSDWHGWMGHDPDIRLPHIPGHELAGTVVACGAAVRNWKPGDKVTLPFVCGCGYCPQCARGHQQICDDQFQPGFTGWGSFAEYTAIEYADNNLVRLPETMPFTTAAALGCRFVTAFRALIDRGRLRSGEWVAVFGCGGVGLSAVMIAAAAGARVIAVDVKEESLSWARRIGATETVNAVTVGLTDSAPQGGTADTTDDGTPAAGAVEAVQELSGGGVHLSVDALGRPDTCLGSVQSLRKQGRHLQVGLLLADESRPPIPMDRVVAWELELLGCHGMQAHRYPELFSLIETGAVDPGQLLGRSITLDEAPAALAGMDSFEYDGITMILPHEEVEQVGGRHG